MTTSASDRPQVSPARPARPRNQRHALTNGRLFKLDSRLDPRTNTWTRRMRDLVEIYIAHLGGHERLSGPQRALVRRISTLDVELEILEMKFALGRKGADIADLDIYSRLAANQKRLFELIGLEQSLRDVTPIDYEARDRRINEAIERRAAEQRGERTA